MTSGILDQIFLQAAAIPTLPTFGHAHGPDLELKSLGGSSLRLPCPLWVTEAHCGINLDRWPAVCKLLRECGIAAVATVQSMTEVSAASVPVRFAECYAGNALDAVEVETADAIIVNTWDRQGQSGWPAGVTTANLRSYLAAIMVAADGNAPVGIAISSRAQTADIRSIVQAGPDFLVLHATVDFVTMQDIVALIRVRSIVDQVAARPIPIAACFPVTSALDAIKLGALGASLVCVDRMVASVLVTLDSGGASNQDSLTAELLGGIAGPVDVRDTGVQVLFDVLRSQQVQLQRRLVEVGAKCFADLELSMLRTDSTDAQQLLGIPSL